MNIDDDDDKIEPVLLFVMIVIGLFALYNMIVIVSKFFLT